MTARPRDPKNVQDAKRDALLSLLRSHVTDPPPRGAALFRSGAVLKWIQHYLSVAFAPRRPFPVYPAPRTARPGLFPIAPAASIALVSDWGTGTPSAYRVMNQIRYVQKPDITIHLGDIYYSGTIAEVDSYFLGHDDFHRGPSGSWALNANHEMYSGGEGYFERVLPAFGQQTSYFCLENEHWRIVGLDTGYHARMFPLLELIASTRLLKLPAAVLDWLRDVVFADRSDHRSVLLLSHHQWYSAFDKEYRRVGNALAPWLDRVHLWFWGHEHRFAGYSPHAHGGAPPVRARCIGHGGMPIELAGEPKRERGLVFWDNRANPENHIGNDEIGYNGSALLNFDGPSLRIEYFDEIGTRLLEERWDRDSSTGRPTGQILYHDPDLSIAPGRTIHTLVQ
ncbi:MAG: metallophosphoesterase family protein [Longimicrobiales bacterium]